MTAEKYYAKVVEICLDVGEKRTSKLAEHPRLLELYGLSGLRTRHFLNAILSSGELTYLEMGVYRGASLSCGLYKNPEVKVYAVDNWHYSPIDHPAIKYEKDADGKDTNKTIPWPNVKLAAEDNIKKYTTNKITLIEKNFTELKKSDIPEPVDIVHLQPNPGVTKEQLTSYLNTLYPLLEVTSVLIMEYHMLGLVKESISEWAIAKKITINSKFEKQSDSLSNNTAWLGGLGVYVLTKTGYYKIMTIELNDRITPKSVISLISYDAEYLPASIKSYYPYVNEIVLGLDKDRISWSGNKFTFEENKLWKELKALDTEGKINIVEDNFHSSSVAIENDNYERNVLKGHCTYDWIFSIDADEELVDAKNFFYNWCPLVAPYRHKLDISFTWFLPFKEFEHEYLVIANPDNRWFKGDKQGFVTTKDKTFTYCRWTENKRVVHSPLGVIHWSFCRTAENLQKKLLNFGHSDRTPNDSFYHNWNITNLQNYHNLTNFKTSGFGDNQWPKLIPVPKNQFRNAAQMEAGLIY